MISITTKINWLGTIHILRKQRRWVGGVGKMLTFAYMVGGWFMANAYVSKILEMTRTFDISCNINSNTLNRQYPISLFSS